MILQLSFHRPLLVFYPLCPQLAGVTMLFILPFMSPARRRHGALHFTLYVPSSPASRRSSFYPLCPQLAGVTVLFILPFMSPARRRHGALHFTLYVSSSPASLCSSFYPLCPQLAGVTVLFILPDALATLYRINGLTYQETRMMHIACQLSIHKGLSLILVMLTRQEFRRHLVLVFESAESIRRTRTTNLLITHTPMRTHSSRLLRFSDNRTSTELSSAIDELPAVEPRPVQPVVSVTPTLQPAAALTYEKSGLVGRDKISAVQTPEWLKKKDSPRQWSWSRLFASSTDDHTDTMSYEVDSDV